MYESIAKPAAVIRLALRYINHIELPEDRAFGEVLKCPPPTPADLPVDVTRFSSRVSFHLKRERELMANVSTGFDPKPGQKKRQWLIDIDAYYASPSLQTTDRLEEKISVEFGRLHTFKNDIFFAILTEKQVEEFE